MKKYDRIETAAQEFGADIWQTKTCLSSLVNSRLKAKDLNGTLWNTV